MLGYNKAFPSEIVGFWGSGTGFAGPFASFLFLGLTALKLDLIYVIVIIYLSIRCTYFSFLVKEST